MSRGAADWQPGSPRGGKRCASVPVAGVPRKRSGGRPFRRRCRFGSARPPLGTSIGPSIGRLRPRCCKMSERRRVMTVQPNTAYVSPNTLTAPLAGASVPHAPGVATFASFARRACFLVWRVVPGARGTGGDASPAAVAPATVVVRGAGAGVTHNTTGRNVRGHTAFDIAIATRIDRRIRQQGPLHQRGACAVCYRPHLNGRVQALPTHHMHWWCWGMRCPRGAGH